jgi:ADP-heptose:LPS heptosyltransferase
MLFKNLERSGRVLLRKVFHLIPRAHQVSVEALPDCDIQKILVARLDNRLGNLLLITPFLQVLRRSFPVSRIDVLVSCVFSEVLRGNPCIDHLLVADKADFIHKPWSFIRFMRDLRRSEYDLCVDLSSSHSFSVSSSAAVRLSGAPYRLGFRRGESDRFLNVLVSPPEEMLHESAIHLKLLERINPKKQELRLQYFIREDEVLKGIEMVRDMGIASKPIVAVFIGARGEKAWGDRKFLEVARELAGDFQVVIMGGDREKEMLRAIRDEEAYGIHIAPVVPIRQFASLVKQCCLFISGDCGPMHLASALGVRVLAIFKVKNYQKYRPLGKGNRVLYHPDERIPSHVVKVAREMLYELSVEGDPDQKAVGL